MELVLRSGRRSRRRRRLPPDPRGRRTWVEGAELALRPPEADSRAVPGHWEGDLVVGSDGASCLVTLVERSTRFLLASRLEAHPSETVAGRLAEMVSGLPAALSRTLTWDQGVEMARWRDFAAGLRGLLLRPAQPVAARHQREHQRPAQAVLPEGDGLRGGDRRGGAGGAGPAQRQAARDARVAEPRRGDGGAVGFGCGWCNHSVNPPRLTARFYIFWEIRRRFARLTARFCIFWDFRRRGASDGASCGRSGGCSSGGAFELRQSRGSLTSASRAWCHAKWVP